MATKRKTTTEVIEPDLAQRKRGALAQALIEHVHIFHPRLHDVERMDAERAAHVGVGRGERLHHSEVGSFDRRQHETCDAHRARSVDELLAVGVELRCGRRP